MIRFLGSSCACLTIRVVHNSAVHCTLLRVPSSGIPHFIGLPPRTPHQHGPVVLLSGVLHCYLSSVFGNFFSCSTLGTCSVGVAHSTRCSLIRRVRTDLVRLVSSDLGRHLATRPIHFICRHSVPGTLIRILHRGLAVSHCSSVIPNNHCRGFGSFVGFPGINGTGLIGGPLPHLHRV